MVAHLIKWSVHNPLLVVLATLALAAVGLHSFQNVNVEAYPDPAPAIVEVIAQNRGRSAEDMERLVTVPLEVALSGMPGLKNLRTKSLFGLTYVNTQFEYGFPYKEAPGSHQSHGNGRLSPRSLSANLASFPHW